MTLLTSLPPIDPTPLEQLAQTRSFQAGRPVHPKPTPDGKAVLFLRSGPRDARQTLFSFDVASGQTTEVLTPEAVLQGAQETLTVAEKAQLERQRVSARGFTHFQLSPDGTKLLTALSGKLYVVERATGRVTRLPAGPGACLDPSFSPDGRLVAWVRDHDVEVLSLADLTVHAVTTGGTETRPHGLAEFIAQEEMSRFRGYWFSPDARQVLYQASDLSQLERFGVADPMRPEAEPERFFYPRPGKANAQVKLGLVSVDGGPTTWVQWDATAFPYLATVTWPAHGPLTVLVQNREQTKEQLLAVDAATGQTRVLVTEEDEAWLNLAQDFPAWLPDGSGFFWFTERHGGNEIELRRADGSLDGSWVGPEAGFIGEGGFVAWDEKAKTLFFLAGARPTDQHLYQVTRGGSPVQVKTATPEHAHLQVEATDAAQLFVLTTTTFTSLPVTTVLRRDGSLAGTVPSVALAPSIALHQELVHLEPSDRWARVNRPRTFLPGHRYPVILEVYGGPGRQQVSETPRGAFIAQWLADQGFVVVTLDGRGTPRRGRAFERALKYDFATAPMEDQVAGLRALGQRFPELDLQRVGVYGWSFGGYLAALLGVSRGDVVKSAVAGAPVTEWLDYDTHYTERYLGLPQAHPEAYARSSLLPRAPEAKRPLLLVHGTADDNVYFLHTLKLSDALFRAGKPHQVLPLTNFTHMVPEPLVTQRLYERIAAFFRETL